MLLPLPTSFSTCAALPKKIKKKKKFPALYLICEVMLNDEIIAIVHAFGTINCLEMLSLDNLLGRLYMTFWSWLFCFK